MDRGDPAWHGMGGGDGQFLVQLFGFPGVGESDEILSEQQEGEGIGDDDADGGVPAEWEAMKVVSQFHFPATIRTGGVVLARCHRRRR